jgi:hypothetical protein
MSKKVKHNMNRKGRITTALVALVVAVSFAALAAPVSAQSVDNVQTTLSDTDGDDLDDQVQVDVTVSNANSGQVTVELGETNFDVDVSPTDTTDGNQAQFVTPQDTDGDGTNEAVEFVSIGTVSTTYTVVADLSGQADGNTGTVNVALTGGTTDSTSFSVGGQDGDNSEDTDGNDQTDGEDEGDDGGDESDDDSNGTGSSDEGDGGSDGAGGSNRTDGEDEGDGGGDEIDDDSDVTDGNGGSGSGSGSGGEGMPGFTPIPALLALILSAAYHDRG